MTGKIELLGGPLDGAYREHKHFTDGVLDKAHSAPGVHRGFYELVERGNIYVADWSTEETS